HLLPRRRHRAADRAADEAFRRAAGRGYRAQDGAQGTHLVHGDSSFHPAAAAWEVPGWVSREAKSPAGWGGRIFQSPPSQCIRSGKRLTLAWVPWPGRVTSRSVRNSTVTWSAAGFFSWYSTGWSTADAPSGTGPLAGRPRTSRVVTTPWAYCCGPCE